MARLTKRKVVFFTTAQAEKLAEIANSPQYQYNNEPSVAAVVRDAVDFFLHAKSTTVDDNEREVA